MSLSMAVAKCSGMQGQEFYHGAGWVCLWEGLWRSLKPQASEFGSSCWKPQRVSKQGSCTQKFSSQVKWMLMSQRNQKPLSEGFQRSQHCSLEKPKWVCPLLWAPLHPRLTYIHQRSSSGEESPLGPEVAQEGLCGRNRNFSWASSAE